VEDVDFRYGKAKPEEVGHKALGINLSDLAAMGAKPVAYLITLGIPRRFPATWVARFYDGLNLLARRYRVTCLGGDLSEAKQWTASVTILGRCEKDPISRQGARPGDILYVTGSLGGAIRRHHLCFQPRVEQGLFLSSKIKPRAMIDISDGLVQDLGHILSQSKVGAELRLDQIPISKDAFQMARGNQEKAVRRALTDGEDFELLFSIPAHKQKRLETGWRKQFPRVRLRAIGSIRKTPGIRWFNQNKPVKSPVAGHPGYEHFR
jgi:thiamine-monophosphate kinase